MNKTVHIVCIDAPAPPDYGGAIDMFYKIKALAEAGMKVLLHYFHYNERGIGELESYCSAVYRYPRRTGVRGLSLNLPYIVSSRIHPELIRQLNEDDYPVLLEGVHCTGVLSYLNKKRKVIVRMHNDEAVYYQQLMIHETNILKKIYFKLESRYLKHYQKMLPTYPDYACLSSKDLESFKEKYHFPHLCFLPCFLPWQTIESKTGLGSYCLYHGNLTVPENEKAAIWLVKEIVPQLNFPIVIAGKNASTTLKQLIAAQKKCTLMDTPSDAELKTLIQEAQIHILPSFNQTGVKLKLLHALFQGRHCITNPEGIAGSGINKGVHIANTTDQFISLINTLKDDPFTDQEIQQRQETLRLYNNSSNADKLIAWLNLHYQ